MRPRVGLELQGRYTLVERIALGGMGEVWRATDLRSGRAVAVKILRPELAGDEIFLSRLRAEATNSRGLRHPNLAVVLDSGEKEGTGWIVMELVQGRALSDILTERGTLPPSEILPVLAQVARALQVVHDSGVVHRDVKPSNILINREGLAKLTDFGISTGLNQRPMTASGMVMGTAQYLAPEQAMGNMATPAGDLYGLGIIAYEALAGRRPFTGATQVDIAFSHVNDDVPPLPDTLPPQVSDVVLSLLAKKPKDRPASAREVARTLDRIVVNLPPEPWTSSGALGWEATGRRQEPGHEAPQPEGSTRDSAFSTHPTRPRQTAQPAHPQTPGAAATPKAVSQPGGARSQQNSEDAPEGTPRHASGRRFMGMRLPSLRFFVLVLAVSAVLAGLGTLDPAPEASTTATSGAGFPVKEVL
ncbi:serine/threonine protein kinase [Actinomyces sp. 2119]|uniref:Serine/threonine protein kinase n=1 Tax=Actinomyces lilanjuaniae TaxID=2321394 RepID=A0ABN5PL23_9ACTO|nr:MULTISPECIES: serine/threonine-protein kinase [Actinomyces]AYD88856.1 serine/threonine protein kinase [Actinomyces lilanjuaniae]RJF43839.1 serine/threonine protein kinase [Actinomyces sp. 2119]